MPVEEYELEGAQKQLVDAILSKDRRNLEQMEADGKLPEVEFRYGSDQRTPFLCACYSATVDIVTFLLRHNADPHTRTSTGWNCLHLAAYKGNQDIVSHLLDQEARLNPDQTTADGCTALLLAAQQGHQAIVNLLFDYKANVNVADKGGFTPLLRAACNGHVQVVQELLEMRATLNAKTHQGKDAMLLACQGGHLNMVKYLRQQGMEMSSVDHQGQTCLHLAAAYGQLSIVQYICLQKLCDIDVVNKAGSSALMVAIQRGHIPVAKDLIKRSSDVNVINSHEWDALQKASFYGHKEIVDVLLKNKELDVNERTAEGCTALILAAQQGHDVIVKSLMSRGADPSIADKSGWTPVHRAAKRGQLTCLKLMIPSNASAVKDEPTPSNMTPLMLASAAGHTEVVRFLLSKKCNAGYTDKKKWDAIRHAYVGGFQPVLDLLGREASTGKVEAEVTKKRVTKNLKMLLTKIQQSSEHAQKLREACILTEGEYAKITSERKKTEEVRSLLTILLKKNPPQIWADVLEDSIIALESEAVVNAIFA